jgi:hypothetical protein
MGQYTNDARNERTEHEAGGSKGEQGGKGSGKVKCSASPASRPAANFVDASSVVGEPIVGELNVPGTSVVKGASTPGQVDYPKGKPGKPMGGKVSKPQGAKDSGY